MLPDFQTCSVAVIGLGYVGLPLALEFAKHQPCLRTGLPLRRRVIGFDINEQRLDELREANDRTNEINAQDLANAKHLHFTSHTAALAEVDVYIITVPTPIDSAKRPDLSLLLRATATVGRAMRDRIAIASNVAPIVIFESTVYPGATEEVCAPVLISESGLEYNKTFFCGYSPERINPGDSEHKLTTITKVTSGSTLEAAAWIDVFYGSIIKAGTHKASSIIVAEAAKVIENSQRDLNIALVNEFSMIFRKLNIDTIEVLEAAGSKWNFLPFRPGLVGGHCIGVDPYYLTHKAEEVGYHPQVVLAGRRINDGMGRWVAEQFVQELARRRQQFIGSHVLILGFSFKEDCPDIRNSKVFDVLEGLSDYGIEFTVVDPLVDPVEARKEYNLEILSHIPLHNRYHAVLVLVPHQGFREMDSNHWRKILYPDALILDIKGIVPRGLNPIRL